MSHEIKRTKNFTDELRKLPKNYQGIVFETIQKLRDNPGYPSLHTKKLKGHVGLFESRVNRDLRLIWQYDDDKIALVDVGRHDILKEY